jgi:uncharacterized protein YbjT (DUF2867 family)
MRVVIAGGHGKIALRLERLLTARHDQAVGIIRNPDHAADVRSAGGEPVVLDLEATAHADLVPHLIGADAVVFAAGAGPGSGAARKETVDHAAAVLLADAAELAGVRRYLMVSAIGADDGPRPHHDEVFAAYIRAKAAADDDIRGRDLDWTILRPGSLTEDPGTGRVALAPDVRRGGVSRDDVASVIVALLDAPATAGLSLDLVAGDAPIDEAVAAVVG